MGRLVREALPVLHDYARKGGKRSRKDQVKRALRFASFAEGLGARAWEQVGKRHVVRFYRHLEAQDLSPSTIYRYELAIRVLWQQLGLKGEPPPFHGAPRKQ